MKVTVKACDICRGYPAERVVLVLNGRKYESDRCTDHARSLRAEFRPVKRGRPA